VDAADDDPPSTPSMNSMQEQALWGGAQAAESPKLVEARAKMMEMLNDQGPVSEGGWGGSEPPQKPSGLDWGEPPPVLGGDPSSESKPPAGPPPVPKKPVGPTPRR